MIYILLPALFVLTLLVVIIILCVLYRKRKKKEKEYEALVQVKMDRMESSYARECRNGILLFDSVGVSLKFSLSNSCQLTLNQANKKLPS